MINYIKIKNHRCFKSFELRRLGKINLLVGRNNSGKSTIINYLTSNDANYKISPISTNSVEFLLKAKYDKLTPENKNELIDILHIIDLNITDIIVDDEDHLYIKSNIDIYRNNIGEGLWRLLNLFMSLIVYSNNDSEIFNSNTFVINNIDFGFDYDTMCEIWKVIWKFVNNYDIQIIATTCSNDCWKALADMIIEDIDYMNVDNQQIILHRIESDKPKSVMFDMQEIVVAKERCIDVF